MAATIKIKNSSTASAVPTSSDLVQGELAVNVTDKRVFTENASGTVVELGTNPSTLTVAADATINGIKVGKGASSVSTNTAVGLQALNANTTGTANGSFGYAAMQLNTTGGANNAFGYLSLQQNTTGSNNTAIGNEALRYNTTASNNTAVGYRAAYSSTTATNVVAIGDNAFYTNTTGGQTVAIGTNALLSNTTGSYNVAVGQQALNSNTTASQNTAVGYQAGYTNTTGTNLVALGWKAGYTNNGNYNTFIGHEAGYSNTSGANNVFVGWEAGYYTTGSKNTFIGGGASNASGGSGVLVTTGSANTIIGNYNGNQGGLDIRSASNNIVISDGDGTPYLFWKSASLTWFFGQLASGAGTNALKWNTSTGAITYDTSSSRYKDNIRNSIYGLNHVMQMRSAQFEYKDTGRSDVGLIAEELQPIIPELVGVNKEGQADSVSYDRIVSVLVKAIQELKESLDSVKAEFDEYKEAHP